MAETDDTDHADHTDGSPDDVARLVDPDLSGELDEIRAELATLRQRHDDLLLRLASMGRPDDAPDDDALEADAPHGDTPPSPPTRIGRRLALSGAAVATGSLLGLLRHPQAAHAATTLAVENGQRNALTRQTTIVNAGAAAAGPTGDGADLDDIDVMFVIDNSASTRLAASAMQIIGRARALTATTTDGGTVIDARAGASDGVGLAAVANGAGGVGIIASGQALGMRAGGGVAGEFIGASYGVTLSGARPIAFTGGHGALGPPVTTSSVGEVAFDLAGSLFYCVLGGTPGEWRRLAGPGAAGALHLLDQPRRVYDSRPGAVPVGPSNGGPKGAMADGEERVIDCTANGAPVPVDAVGLLFNLAVTSTNAAGYLTAWATGLPPLASSMNWSQPNTTLSNSVTISAGDNATFRLLCGGGGAAHVIVDVAGYYR